MDPSDFQALKSLLKRRRVAALATLHKGEPAVSMVPFAIVPGSATFVIHVSRLAAHTKDMLADPAVALLVTGEVESSNSALELPRASVQGRARPCAPEAPEYEQACAAYLAKLPQAEGLFSFSDFSIFLIEPGSVRYVAGFGRAMSVTAKQLKTILGAGNHQPAHGATTDSPGK